MFPRWKNRIKIAKIFEIKCWTYHPKPFIPVNNDIIKYNP